MRAGALQRGLLVASVVSILAATLVPSVGPESTRSFVCLICGQRGMADVLVNVLLFLPFGAALALGGVRPRRCALAGAFLASSIEFAQLFIPGRDPSLGDVVTNTVGAGLGAVLVATAPYWLLPPRSHAIRLSWASAFAAAVLCYGTGWLLTPAPTRTHYFALWTPNVAHLTPYRGRVLDAIIADIRIPLGPIANSAGVREALSATQGFSLLVRSVAGPRPAALAALVAVYDQNQREILLLGPDRDDLVFRMRMRAAQWRLDQPDIRLVSGLRAVDRGDMLNVSMRRHAGRYDVSVNSSALVRLGLTVGSGWGLFMYPERLPAWFKTLLNLGWIAALWVPAGFWARTRREGWVAGATVVAGLLGAPIATPLLGTPFSQWIAAGLGVIAGVCARLSLERRIALMQARSLTG